AEGALQTLSTPLAGATQLRYAPSGLICTLARSGLPNSASRGISSTSSIDDGPVRAVVSMSPLSPRGPQADRATAMQPASSKEQWRMDFPRLVFNPGTLPGTGRLGVVSALKRGVTNGRCGRCYAAIACGSNPR